MVFIRSKSRNVFIKSQLEESAEELDNPGRGWYHIYTLNAAPAKEKIPLKHEIWFYDNADRERLALALIDLSAFKTAPVSDEALSRIDNIFNFFKSAGKQIILRFVYDTDGNSILREPMSLATIKRHMEQTGEIVKKYSDDILVMQGLFIGNWGEMHGSKFSDDISICELTNSLFEYTSGMCPIALRTPSFCRTVISNAQTLPQLKERLTIFNDGMFASPTDLGTYGIYEKEQAAETGKWIRSQELEWQNRELAFVPNGGEAAADKEPISFADAAREMKMSRISYLNSAYHTSQLEFWKNEVVKESGIWNGISGYDYIGRHLGYRFVVRDVKIGKGKELFIEIENCGFANLYRQAQCVLTIEKEDGTREDRILDTDPRRWMSCEKLLIPTGLSLKEKIDQPYNLYVSLKQRHDARPIYFANKGAGEMLKIGVIQINGSF